LEQPGGNDFFETKDGRLYLDVKVIPGSSKTELAGVHDGRLRIRVAAAPEDGKANAVLTAFLSKLFDCPKKEIVIKSGEKSRLKTICLPEGRRERAAGVLGAQA
jgi:uncharacterized protein (TIGR00251 family)